MALTGGRLELPDFELTIRAEDRRLQTWAEVNQLPDLERNFNIYMEITRMSSIPLYKAFIEVGASEESAAKAAEDVIRVSQLEQLATKADLLATKAELKSEIAGLEARLVKWMVGSLFVFAGIIVAGTGILFQIMLSPGVAQ